MPSKHFSLNIGLSDYAITAYMTLLKEHPLNGSQVSRLSGIPRARAYEVLRTLKQKGIVAESSEGMYIPLPPKELIKRLRTGYEKDLDTLQALLKGNNAQAGYDYIWTIQGHAAAMEKAREMIEGALEEIYVRMYPEEGQLLDPLLKKAETEGVRVKYIAMRPASEVFELQVIHPDYETIEDSLGGRSFDLVVDHNEILGGLFITGQENRSVIYWGKNRWFVVTGRDSIRHDFFHYFLHKTYTLNQSLNPHEKSIYDLIRKDS